MLRHIIVSCLAAGTLLSTMLLTPPPAAAAGGPVFQFTIHYPGKSGGV